MDRPGGKASMRGRLRAGEPECARQGARNGWRGTEAVGELDGGSETVPTGFRRQESTKMAPTGWSVQK